MNLTEKQKKALSSIYRAIVGSQLTTEDLLNLAMYTQPWNVSGEPCYITDWASLGIDSSGGSTQVAWVLTHVDLAPSLGINYIPQRSVDIGIMASILSECEAKYLAVPFNTPEDRVLAVFQAYGAIVHKSQFKGVAGDIKEQYFRGLSQVTSLNDLKRERKLIIAHIDALIKEKEAAIKPKLEDDVYELL